MKKSGRFASGSGCRPIYPIYRLAVSFIDATAILIRYSPVASLNWDTHRSYLSNSGCPGSPSWFTCWFTYLPMAKAQEKTAPLSIRVEAP